MTEFSVIVPAHESIITAALFVAAFVWLLGTFVLVFIDLGKWGVVSIQDRVRHPNYIGVSIHDHAKSFTSNPAAKDFRCARRVRYGRYRMSALEKVFLPYGLYKRSFFGAPLPYEFDIEMIDVTRSILSESFTVRFHWMEGSGKERKLKDRMVDISDSTGERIPINNDGSGPALSDYKISARWIS